VFGLTPEGIALLPDAFGTSPLRAPEKYRQREARDAEGWYRNIVADSYRLIATPDVQVNSREGFKAYYQDVDAIYPDQRMTVEILVAEGDKVRVYPFDWIKQGGDV